MGANAAQETGNGVLEDFRIEFLSCWNRLPNKGLFLMLFAAWLALFQFLGNSTLGYVHSPSLFRWLLDAYSPTGDYAASEQGFAVLMPFLVLGLFWWKREELVKMQLRLWWPGLLLFALALGLHLLAYLVQQPKISVVAFFAGVYALMGLAWGPAWLRGCFFPFFLFALCVPMGEQILPVTFRLRLLVSQLVEWFAREILDINIVREGTLLGSTVHHYAYNVEAACSGMRSLLTTVGLALVYGFVTFRPLWKRAVLIAAAFPLAVLGNFARLLSIIVAAEFGGQSAGSYVHEGGPFGLISLLPYIPAFVGLFLIGHWLRPREPELTLPAEMKTA